MAYLVYPLGNCHVSAFENKILFGRNFLVDQMVPQQ
jgi:hypothetical protein